jgi:hypothetical protein
MARRGEDGMSTIVGDSVSGVYVGIASRIAEYLGADDDDGHCRCCLLVWFEWLDSDEAVLSLLEAPRRCGARGMPDRLSPGMPTRFPISVEVRSIDEMAVEASTSCLPPPAATLDMRDRFDRFDARLVRPLTGPLGSLSVSIVPSRTRDGICRIWWWCSAGERGRKMSAMGMTTGRTMWRRALSKREKRVT